MGFLRRRWVRTTIQVVVIGAVAALFAVALVDNWNEVVRRGLALSWWHVVATVLFALAVPVSGLLWGSIVGRMDDRRIGALDAMAVHCSSWLLKYIPGQVGSVINKVQWGKRNGHSRTVMLISFIYENLFLQVASIVPSVVILVVALGTQFVSSNLLWSVIVVVGLALVVAALSPPVLRRVLGLASRRVLKQDLPPRYVLGSGDVAWFSIAFMAPRVVNGVGFVLIAGTVAEVTPGDWLPLAAAYTLAGAIGILAVFVPSGLGVREAILYACLVGLGFDAGQAVLMSVLARLASTVGDAVVAALYGGLRLAVASRGRA